MELPAFRIEGQKKASEEGRDPRSKGRYRRKLSEAMGRESFKAKEAFHSGISGAAKRLKRRKAVFSGGKLSLSIWEADFAGREREKPVNR